MTNNRVPVSKVSVKKLPVKSVLVCGLSDGLLNKRLLKATIISFSVAFSAISMLSVTGCQSTGAQPIQASNYSVLDATKNREKKDPKEIARIRTTLAGQYIRKNQLDAATRQLNLAFESYRRYAPAYDMMGVLLQQDGSPTNLKKAEKYFKKAIRIDRNFTRAHNNYGVYLSLMKRYKEAARELEIAGSTLGYEGRVAALENLGKTYLKLNNDKAAMNAFVRALETSPNSMVARMELVDLLIKVERVQQARSLFEEVKSLLGNRPLNPRLMLQGAKISHALGDTQGQQQYAGELLAT
ncbi:MAG: type IV pilus biogenesis/stability protein PilW, partial [Pseudomonadales bacterium]